MGKHVTPPLAKQNGLQTGQKNYPASRKMTLQCFSEHLQELSTVL